MELALPMRNEKMQSMLNVVVDDLLAMTGLVYKGMCGKHSTTNDVKLFLTKTAENMDKALELLKVAKTFKKK